MALMHRITMEPGDVPRDHGKMKISLGSTLHGHACACCVWEQDQDRMERDCKVVCSNARAVKDLRDH